jgi:hypothetical protein
MRPGKIAVNTFFNDLEFMEIRISYWVLRIADLLFAVAD